MYLTRVILINNGKSVTKVYCDRPGAITLDTFSSVKRGAWMCLLGLIRMPLLKMPESGPRGRVVKVTDFSALNHSIISPLWVRASLGARVTCGTSQVLLAGVSGGFSPGTPVFAPPTD